MLAANLRQTASPPGFTGTPKSPSSSRVRATSTRQKPVSAPNQKVPVIQLTPSFSKWPFAVPTERLKWNILFLKCGLLGSSMKPINALRMIFTRQKSVPRTDLEYLYTDEQGLASAQALANKHNGEEKVFYNMALV